MNDRATRPAQILFLLCFPFVLLMPLVAVSMNPGIELKLAHFLADVAQHEAPSAITTVASR